MPLYSYRCTLCEHQYERSARIADRHSPDGFCPECGAESTLNSELVPTSPMLVPSVGSFYSKTTTPFREKMESLKKHYPRGTIKT